MRALRTRSACTLPKRLSRSSMTTAAASAFVLCGVAATAALAGISTLSCMRSGVSVRIDFDRHRHALAQSLVAVGRIDDDAQAIHQVGAQIGGLHRLRREFVARRDEADLAAIDLVGSVAHRSEERR